MTTDAYDELADLRDMVAALALHGWEVHRASLYDEEGVEGWCWTDHAGHEYHDVGDWTEAPPWPESARIALAASLKPTP